MVLVATKSVSNTKLVDYPPSGDDCDQAFTSSENLSKEPSFTCQEEAASQNVF